ncbi:MAG: hypothetical protein HPY74_07025 [Firmicutes bacterium]|nr:hypothetical protein [Bacillota bacterium]
MVKNLDSELNKLGYKIYKDIKDESNKSTRKNLANHVDKALGVLTNDGVYAYYVFCLSKDKEDNKNKYSKIFIENPVNIIKSFLPSNYKNLKDEQFFQELSKNLHDLLFFRDLLEKALIYARYHLKTLGDEHE